MTIALAAILDTAAAGPLRIALRKALEEQGPIVVDGAGVERAGQACLQVLAAGQAAAEGAGQSFRIDDPAPALVDVAMLAGLRSLLTA